MHRIHATDPAARTARRGSVLVPALMVVMLMAVLSMSYVQLSLAKGKESRIEVDSKRAFYMAEAGLAEGYAALATGGGGAVASESVPARLGNGVFWVTAEEHGDRVTLKSTGVSGLGRASLSTTLQRSAASVASLGVFARQELTLAAGAQVDAYDSRLGPYAPPVGHKKTPGLGADPLLAHVASNASITLAGASGATAGAKITGDAIPGPGGSVVRGTGALVTGSTTPADAPTSTPALDIVVPQDAQPLDLTSHRPVVLPQGSHAYTTLHVHNLASLTIHGPADVVADQLIVDAGGALVIDGTAGAVNLSVRSYVNIAPGAGFSTSNDGTDRAELLIGASESADRNGDGVIDPPVTLAGTGAFYGSIYAPGALVALPACFTIYGSIAADRIALGENARLHFDRALLDAIAEGSLPQILGWCVVELPDADLVKFGVDPLTVLEFNHVVPVKPAQAHLGRGVVPVVGAPLVKPVH